MTKSLLASLYALRAQVEAVVAQVEDAMGMPGVEPGGCPKCGAPEDKVADDSTIGVKAFHCTVCGHEWELSVVT